MRLYKVSLFILCCVLSVGGARVFAMSSTNFQIPWDNVNAGGLDNASSTNFSSRDTLGDNASGTSTSANFQLSAGYRAPEGANTLTYTVRSRSSSVSTNYAAFDNALGTVTVSSTASFSVGDLIAVVENVGFSQLVAVGKISAIGSGSFTVDTFEGDGGTMSASSSGGDDTVYLLNSNSIDFGTIVSGTAYTSVVGTSVSTNIPTGYSIYILANQQLQNTSAQVMTSVADGAVTVGSEEYGAETTGATAFSAGTDLAVTTTQRIVQTAATSSGAISDKIGMIYKLSISGTTNSGTYSQSVFYTLTANY